MANNKFAFVATLTHLLSGVHIMLVAAWREGLGFLQTIIEEHFIEFGFLIIFLVIFGFSVFKFLRRKKSPDNNEVKIKCPNCGRNLEIELNGEALKPGNVIGPHGVGKKFEDKKEDLSSEFIIEKFLEIGDTLSDFQDKVMREAKLGIGTSNRRRTFNCVLFAGVNGAEKVRVTKILASYLKMPLYRVNMSTVVSKYIGETEKNLQQVFDDAEESNAILFFDEAEDLFGNRSEVRDAHDRYANTEINYFLERMENHHGLVILATNMREDIDSAFMRRIRFIVNLPSPSKKTDKKFGTLFSQKQ